MNIKNKSFGERAFTPLIPLFPLPQNEKQNLILFKSDPPEADLRKTYITANNTISGYGSSESLHPNFLSLRSRKLRISVNVK